MSVSSRIHKVLIANRGEIACRVVKTAKRLGIRTVGVYSDVDANSMHASVVDEAYYIGRPPPQESYLRGDKIIEVAKRCDARAVHPGYGFLSENAEFAEMCAKSGIIFIGPPPSAIRDMGIKSTSKQIMSEAGVPVIPGYHGEDQSETALLREADKIGYPLMIKAVRGGGGKGMRIVTSADDFLSQLESAKRESLKSFGDDAVLLERYVSRPRHIEVQIFGDSHGNYVYLYERDCSVQRRHQKVIEQAPAPGVGPELRKQLGEAAVKAAKAVGYIGAGTVEFILDTDTNKFYFMEMNTRLQVEHPVTEMITGVDLVEWQLLVAAGGKIPMSQDEIPLRGCSLEARLYAEDVAAGFVPTGGSDIAALLLPKDDRHNVRIESGVREGDNVSVHYDPMIAKLVVWDSDPAGAFSKLEQSLSQFNIVGVENNVEFLRKLSRHQDLIEGNVHTGFIEQHRSKLIPESVPVDLILHAAVSVILKDEISAKESTMKNNDPFSPFAIEASFRLNMSHERIVTVRHRSSDYKVKITLDSGHIKAVPLWNSKENDGSNPTELNFSKATLTKSTEHSAFLDLTLQTDARLDKSLVAFKDNYLYLFNKDENIKLEIVSEYLLGSAAGSGGLVANQAVSPMPGVLEKIFVKAGDTVKRGDSIAVVIAMKMEHVIKSDRDGIIESVLYQAGNNVSKNAAIVKFKEN